MSPIPRGQGAAIVQRQRLRADSTSGFKGVHPHPTPHGTRWRAQISLDGRKESLGLFDRPEDAARAYDSAALDAYGPTAWTNAEHGNLRGDR